MVVLVSTQKDSLFTGSKAVSWKRVWILEPDGFDPNPALLSTSCMIPGNSFKCLVPQFPRL